MKLVRKTDVRMVTVTWKLRKYCNGWLINENRNDGFKDRSGVWLFYCISETKIKTTWKRKRKLSWKESHKQQHAIRKKRVWYVAKYRKREKHLYMYISLHRKRDAKVGEHKSFTILLYFICNLLESPINENVFNTIQKTKLTVKSKNQANREGSFQKF
jgi:hypothetical protein